MYLIDLKKAILSFFLKFVHYYCLLYLIEVVGIYQAYFLYLFLFVLHFGLNQFLANQNEEEFVKRYYEKENEPVEEEEDFEVNRPTVNDPKLWLLKCKIG